MPAITLDLQEGFAGEAVEVRLDGALVWRGEVRTDWSIGLAERVEVEVSPKGGTVGVAVPSRPASIDLVLGPGEAPVLGVSLIGGGLVALGVGIANLATRELALVPLIWAHAVLPGLIALAWLVSPSRARVPAAEPTRS